MERRGAGQLHRASPTNLTQPHPPVRTCPHYQIARGPSWWAPSFLTPLPSSSARSPLPHCLRFLTSLTPHPAPMQTGLCPHSPPATALPEVPRATRAITCPSAVILIAPV